MQRALSPRPFTAAGYDTRWGSNPTSPRAPSRSMTPAPVFQFLSPSRPGATPSNYHDQDGVGREPHHVACVLPHLCIARAISRSDAAAARPGRAPIYYGSISAGTGSGGSSTNNIPCMTRLSVSSVSFDNLHAKVRGVYRTLQFCVHNTCITEMSDTPHLMVCVRAAGGALLTY